MNLWTRYRLKRQGLAGGKLRKKLREGPLRSAIEAGYFAKALIAVTSCAGCVWIIAMGQTPSRETIDLFVGQPAPKDVFSDIGFSYENREETEHLKREAAQKVLPQYSFSSARLRECAQGLAESIRGAAVTRADRKGRAGTTQSGCYPLRDAPSGRDRSHDSATDDTSRESTGRRPSRAHARHKVRLPASSPGPHVL